MITIHADSVEDADEKARACVERRSEQAQDGSGFQLVAVQPALEEARLEPLLNGQHRSLHTRRLFGRQTPPDGETVACDSQAGSGPDVASGAWIIPALAALGINP
jgi:hypothetical protein